MVLNNSLRQPDSSELINETEQRIGIAKNSNEKTDSIEQNELEYARFDHSYSTKTSVAIGCLNVCGLRSKLLSHEFINEVNNFDFFVFE